MVVSSDKSEAVDDYILKCKPHIMPIMIALRDIIHESAPDINEVVRWGHPVYSMKSKIFHMYSGRDHVKLAFFDGSNIEDPDDYLDGDGKTHRHKKFYSLDDIDVEKLKRVIHAAVEYDLANMNT